MWTCGWGTRCWPRPPTPHQSISDLSYVTARVQHCSSAVWELQVKSLTWCAQYQSDYGIMSKWHWNRLPTVSVPPSMDHAHSCTDQRYWTKLATGSVVTWHGHTSAAELRWTEKGDVVGLIRGTSCCGLRRPRDGNDKQDPAACSRSNWNDSRITDREVTATCQVTGSTMGYLTSVSWPQLPALLLTASFLHPTWHSAHTHDYAQGTVNVSLFCSVTPEDVTAFVCGEASFPPFAVTAQHESQIVTKRDWGAC